jgi:N-acetylmuramate 1-kinase
VEPVSQDGSDRRYSRIEKNGHTAIYMDCGYSRTAASDISDFMTIGNWLNDIGLNAPDIYEQGRDYLVIEDFGDLTFKKALVTHNPVELYDIAVEVLTHLREQKEIPVLPNYYQSNVHKGHRRIIDWYVPVIKRQENPQGMVQEYLDVWAQIERHMVPAPKSFVHADFHFENLMWIPDEKQLRRCGIIDFQGAMNGPDAYDLGNLLEDARLDVPMEIQSRYLATQDRDFKIRYRILTTQFHCRVIGQFIKMAARDHKTGYLQYIPRVQTLIRRALQDPLLKPLKEFLDKNGVSLNEKPDLTDIKSLVDPNAF